MDRYAFGNAVGCATQSPGDVGSVAVAILHAQAIVDGGCTVAHPARKFAVSRAQTSVQNVDTDTCPIHGIGISAVQRQGALINPIQPPSG